MKGQTKYTARSWPDNRDMWIIGGRILNWSLTVLQCQTLSLSFLQTFNLAIGCEHAGLPMLLALWNPQWWTKSGKHHRPVIFGQESFLESGRTRPTLGYRHSNRKSEAARQSIPYFRQCEYLHCHNNSIWIKRWYFNSYEKSRKIQELRNQMGN